MKTVKKKSQIQEKRVAKELNAKTVVASGALWGAKGDVRSDDFLVECKTTEKPYYTLTASTWKKIQREATRDGLRVPVMCIEICGKSYAVLEKSVAYDYLVSKGYCFNEQDVRSKSFRIKSYADWVAPFCINCQTDSNDWGRSTTHLIQMRWQLFVEIADKLL